ncbi:MAG: hypothetical protein OWU84_00445 [Firmicutes bacterium]|nr:hypothetical protein [Bacillota bacterium]
MAIVYWRFGHVSSEGCQSTLASFVVFRDGMVFDVDQEGWDRGIRWGDRLVEMKWRYPEATWVPWQAGDYQKSWQTLQRWLDQHARTYQQRDVRYGWWEVPRLKEEEWRQLMEEVVPRWARRLEAGMASHPWLAQWAAEAGRELKVTTWSSPFWKTYVLKEEDEQRLWPLLPLPYVQGIPLKVRQEWHKRGWKRVQDVPGLWAHLRQQVRTEGLGAMQAENQELMLVRHFDEPVSFGVGEVLREMACELTAYCRERNQGVQTLRVSWCGEAGVEQRERTWPVATGEARAIMARVLSLLDRPPSRPFDRAELAAQCTALKGEQLTWWQEPLRRSSEIRPVALRPWSLSRRELLLQQWDLWRMAGGRR